MKTKKRLLDFRKTGIVELNDSSLFKINGGIDTEDNTNNGSIQTTESVVSTLNCGIEISFGGETK